MAAISSVCRKRGVAAILLFFKLDNIYVVYCSGESGGDGEGEKGQSGFVLVVRKSIFRAEARPPEFINDRLLKVTLELCGRARVVTFVVGYAPTDTQYVVKKHAFWAALERVVKEVPEHEQLFVFMNARPVQRWGAGGDVTHLSPFWEESAQK